MPLQKKRSPGLKQLPGNAFLFFVAACFLGAFLPAGLAADKTQKQKTGETFIRQIGPASREAPLDIGKVYQIVWGMMKSKLPPTPEAPK